MLNEIFLVMTKNNFYPFILGKIQFLLLQKNAHHLTEEFFCFWHTYTVKIAKTIIVFKVSEFFSSNSSPNGYLMCGGSNHAFRAKKGQLLG